MFLKYSYQASLFALPSPPRVAADTFGITLTDARAQLPHPQKIGATPVSDTAAPVIPTRIEAVSLFTGSKAEQGDATSTLSGSQASEFDIDKPSIANHQQLKLQLSGRLEPYKEVRTIAINRPAKRLGNWQQNLALFRERCAGGHNLLSLTDKAGKKQMDVMKVVHRRPCSSGLLLFT